MSELQVQHDATLLLNEGKSLIHAPINKLIAFEKSEGARDTLFIRPTAQTNAIPQETAR